LNECIFCKIINKELLCSRIWEDDVFLVFMDIKPVNPGQILIIPKVYAELISEIVSENVGKMMIIAWMVGNAVRRSGLRREGVNLFLAGGVEAGQEIFHVHLHLIPRFRNDGFGFNVPEGYDDIPGREELDKASARERSNLDFTGP